VNKTIGTGSEGHDAMGLKGPVTNLEDMRNRAFTLNALVDSKDQELE
jgi:hypothetical protein